MVTAILTQYVRGRYVLGPSLTYLLQAWGYSNEEYVGKAIRESGVPRSEIFLTTKLWYVHVRCVRIVQHTSHNVYLSRNANHHRVREAFETSLAALNCEYIDLYLMHWPQAEIDGAYTTRLDSERNNDKYIVCS